MEIWLRSCQELQGCFAITLNENGLWLWAPLLPRDPYRTPLYLGAGIRGFQRLIFF